MENKIEIFQTREIKDYKLILEGLTKDFGYSYYHAILAWCGIIDNSSPEDFWEVWVIKVDSNIVGICGLYSQYPNFTEELWLGWFGIIPEHRNKKIGEYVLDFLKMESKTYNCKIILSYVDKNGGPLNFYKRNGFLVIGKVSEYIKDKPRLNDNFEEYFQDLEDYIIKYENQETIK